MLVKRESWVDLQIRDCSEDELIEYADSFNNSPDIEWRDSKEQDWLSDAISRRKKRQEKRYYDSLKPLYLQMAKDLFG